MSAQQAEKESDAVVFEKTVSELIDKIQKLSVADRLHILTCIAETLNDIENGNIYQTRRRNILVTVYPAK
ncbi:MAG: hypothetical protein K2K16_05875 [Ruminococcus sp.]|nr:hypothetical protein [Ruminococcus sp.]